MGGLTAIVLGAAAGGGYPQWNCRCRVCALAWAGDRRVKARTQAGVAVSGDGKNWILLNASPDLRAQVQATASLQPAAEPRGSPIAAVVLTGAEIDQAGGLLAMRERHAFAVYATAETLAAVFANPMFNALAPDLVARNPVRLGEYIDLPGGIEAELFAVPGKVPLYLEDDSPDLMREGEANVGIALSAGGKRLVFVPGAAAVTPVLCERLCQATAVLFDGTLFSDNEMIASGTGSKTGRRMGHMPIDGDEGSLAALAQLSARRIYIHINNTNPILIEGAPERRKVEEAGWDIAEDGMRIVL